MHSTDCPSPFAEAVLRADIPDYALLFHPHFGNVLALTPVALAVWRAIDGQRTVAEIAAQVQVQFEDAPSDILADVTELVDDLQRTGFVSTTPDLLFPTEASSGATVSPPFVGSSVVASGNSPVVLSLADGSRFSIVAGDELAAQVVTQFAASACLSGKAASLSEQNRSLQKLRVVMGGYSGSVAGEQILALQLPGIQPKGSGGCGSQDHSVPLVSETQWLCRELIRLSALISQQVQPRGGILMHSALALLPEEMGGGGALLGGRSGVGKSTASRRLPLPWRSLCDDFTLIVRDDAGQYWAHPWPTWSRLNDGHTDDRWDVEAAVPLRAIFVLEQGSVDRCQPISPAEAIAQLMDVSHQASHRLWISDHIDWNALPIFHRQRFENVCALVDAIPTCLLDVTLEGTFWREIERYLTHVHL